MKTVKSFRISQELLDKAESMGLNLSQLVSASLAAAVKDERCPYCKQALIKKKAQPL